LCSGIGAKPTRSRKRVRSIKMRKTLTKAIAHSLAMERFNPDGTWEKVEEDAAVVR